MAKKTSSYVILRTQRPKGSSGVFVDIPTPDGKIRGMKREVFDSARSAADTRVRAITKDIKSGRFVGVKG